MTEVPTIKLSRLREIGWSRWDPIGLRNVGDGAWQDGGACADEYDSYLLQVVGQLRRNVPAPMVAAYLEDVEVRHMGNGGDATTRSRTEATVAAVADYLASLPAGPLKVR